ncbi:hypothetical protein BJX61DRAFT_76011 [Aspergillus egyptiacus]|nr:hypothetical protein BJX61DRAFT_76011 [Aspergillus egyptiacus]
MPHFRHHKRRHSWPYCGAGAYPHTTQNIPTITVTRPPDELEPQFLASIMSEELADDDAASAGIVRSENRSHHRLWYSSKRKPGDDKASVGTGSLRKMVQPPLDRARSLFTIPPAPSIGEAVLLPYWIYRISAHPIASSERAQSQEEERGRLAAVKNHRRCHSERPRSWKKPSKKLWTLEEE